jgi:hypothetical protein
MNNYETAKSLSKVAFYCGFAGFFGGALVFSRAIVEGHAAGDPSVQWGEGIFISGVGGVAYYHLKTREEIRAKTTKENMRALYARPQRESIYHPATIGDIPQDVMQKALLHLGRKDLISASSVCRGWRPVAQEIIHSRLFIDYRNVERAKRLMCVYCLHHIVFGSESYQTSSYW